MVQRARELHEGGNALTKLQMEIVCPELAESEDEKIREELLQFFHQTLKQRTTVVPKDNYKRWIAYLEKKKEQNAIPSRETILGIWELGNLWEENPEEKDGLTKLQYIQKYWFEKCDYVEKQKPEEDWRKERKKECPFRKDNSCERYVDAVCECTGNCSWVVDYPKLKEIQDKKEQKPAVYTPKFKVGDKVISTGNTHLTYDILEVGLINELGKPDYRVEIFKDGKPGIPELKKEHNIHLIDCQKMDSWAKLIEQNPSEWSEEDATKIGTLSAIIFDYAFYKDALDENNDLTGEYAELEDWLECLPERFNLQPKQEWSEEDRKMLNTIISDGSRGVEFDAKQVNFLKSLCPQPHWKPSQEQFTALRHAADVLRENWQNMTATILLELYNDLKTL